MKVDNVKALGWKKKYKAKDLIVCKMNTINRVWEEAIEGVSFWWEHKVMANWGKGFLGVCVKNKDGVIHHITTNTKLKIADVDNVYDDIGRAFFMTQDRGKLFDEGLLKKEKLENKKLGIKTVFHFEEKINKEFGTYDDYVQNMDVDFAHMNFKYLVLNNEKKAKNKEEKNKAEKTSEIKEK